MSKDELSFQSQNFQGNAYTPSTTDDMDYAELNKNRGLASSALESQIDQMDAEMDRRNQAAMETISMGMSTMPDDMTANPTGGYAENSGYYDLLADVESKGMGGYKAQNKSGAYGKYQFMPGTEKATAKKLGLTIQQARTPDGQERMIRRFTRDNIDGLRRNGIPVTKETMWWAHNQGLQGAINLYKGGKVSAKNLKSNGGKNSNEYIAKWRKIFGGGNTQPRGLASS